MIFSTRYIDKDHITQSIFSDCVEQDDSIIPGEMTRVKLRAIEKSNDVISLFHLKNRPEKLVDVANILSEKGNAPNKFSTTPAINKLLPIQISNFIKNNIDSLSLDCLIALAPYVLPSYSLKYRLKEESMLEGDDKVTYRAIGVMHLPEGKTEFGKIWANILAKRFQYGEENTEEVYLFLHAGTDWEDDVSGRLVEFSTKFSKELSKNISVFLFHHDPQIYPISKWLLSQEMNLQNIWSAISKM